MAEATAARRGRGRLAFGVNGALAVVMVAIVAAFALVVSPPSPPGIAAFAPTATKPITKAPLSQSAVNGQGTGACAAGQSCAAASPTPSLTPSAAPSTSQGPMTGVHVGVPSALQCYTWPDGTVTQTFDPQSPPCIASWPDQAKGNGGATSQGVTGTEIQVAVPKAATGSQLAQFTLLAQFFNTHFQLYGRRLVLKPVPSQELSSSGSTLYADPSLEKADAEGIAAVKPFAAVDFVDGSQGVYTIALPEYIDTLAKHHVISSVGGFLPPNSASLDAHAPYEWTYLPTLPSVFRSLGGLTCRQLVGHPASHSPSMSAKTRKFALLMPDASEAGGSYPGLSQLLSRLAACGVKPPVVYYKGNSGDNAVSASLAKFRTDGVTTILFLPDSGIGSATPQQAAQNAGYFPEWVLFSGSPLIETNLLSGPKSQTDNSFGVASWDKTLPPATQPWRIAYLQAGGHSTDPCAGCKAFYNELQLIASGVQMAGPHLTPDAFAEALRQTTFPNPGAGAAPSYQSRVDFTDGGHEFIRDFAGFWFSPTGTYGTAPTDFAHQDYELSNNFCWVDLGTRWTSDAWPAADHFKKGSCR